KRFVESTLGPELLASSHLHLATRPRFGGAEQFTGSCDQVLTSGELAEKRAAVPGPREGDGDDRCVGRRLTALLRGGDGDERRGGVTKLVREIGELELRNRFGVDERPGQSERPIDS